MNDYARGRRIGLPTELGRENIVRGYRTLKRSAVSFPAIAREMTLYRGGNEFVMGPDLQAAITKIFDGTEQPDALIGSQFQAASFMSTSYDKRHAFNFARGAAKSVFLQLKVVPGAKAIAITDRVEGKTHRNEKEILFPPDSCKMTVTGVNMTRREKRILCVKANLEQIEENED